MTELRISCGCDNPPTEARQQNQQSASVGPATALARCVGMGKIQSAEDWLRVSAARKKPDGSIKNKNTHELPFRSSCTCANGGMLAIVTAHLEDKVTVAMCQVRHHFIMHLPANLEGKQKQNAMMIELEAN